MATDSNNRQGVRAVATTTTDPQRSEKRAVAARGAAGALALSILALVLQSATTATPTWGYFTNPDGTIIKVHHGCPIPRVVGFPPTEFEVYLLSEESLVNVVAMYLFRSRIKYCNGRCNDMVTRACDA
ncbi:hypothetical protein K0M31_000542 [Melipona bicolor]|uniref:Uncharacterized protein n=1 Tax=Melipona bicolor TaxID=60889 RepID=A0AA40GDR4_9HYME|nr:hypothetical protein K0M31_000542 [Melipona bicolor]